MICRPEIACPKCGSGYIRTEYVPRRKGGGYLARHCAGCGYDWRTPPLDEQEDCP